MEVIIHCLMLKCFYFFACAIAQTGQLGAGTGIGMGLGGGGLGGGGLGLGNTTGLGTTLKPGGLGMGNTAGGLGGKTMGGYV